MAESFRDRCEACYNWFMFELEYSERGYKVCPNCDPELYPMISQEEMNELVKEVREQEAKFDNDSGDIQEDVDNFRGRFRKAVRRHKRLTEDLESNELERLKEHLYALQPENYQVGEYRDYNSNNWMERAMGKDK